MRPEKRTIYFVWNYLRWGGAQVYFLSVIKRTCHDWNIVVILPKDSSKEFLGFLEELGAKCIFLEKSIDLEPAQGVGQILSRQLLRIRSEFAIFKLLRSAGIKGEIVHIEAAPWQSWQLITMLLLLGAHVFVTLHTFRLEGSIIRKLVWKARMQFVSRLPRFHAFASNVYAKERYRTWFARSFASDVKVTYTAVDPVQIAEAAAANARGRLREQFEISETDKVVLTVGQFVDLKGRWDLLDAAADITSIRDDVVFVWLMQDAMDEEAVRRVEDYGLGERFRPITSAEAGGSRQRILEFFSVADIFVLPSHLEGLPIALLEAMALEIPSISTNIYAIPEAIIDGRTGLLVEPRRPDQLSEAILKLLNDENLCRSLAREGSRRVLSTFDEGTSAGTVIAEYNRAIGAT